LYVQFLREKKFEQGIPQLKATNIEEITYETTTNALRRGVRYFTALQASDGHWPGEITGPLFFLPPLIFCLYITGHLEEVFDAEHRKEMLRHIYCHQNEDGGWGLHIESKSVMFCTVLNYICLRMLGENPEQDACKRARQWILDRGGVIFIPSWGKFWLSILGVYDWSGTNPTPPELLMLPSFLPIHPGLLCSADSIFVFRFFSSNNVCPAPKKFENTQGKFCVIAGWLVYLCRIYMGRGLLVQLHLLFYSCAKNFTWNLMKKSIGKKVDVYMQKYVCLTTFNLEILFFLEENSTNILPFLMQEDMYYAHPLVQDLLSDTLQNFVEPLLTRWPLNKLVREKALQLTMKHIHYEDENSHYITIGCVEKVLCMLACWVENPNGDYFKKHLARIPDYMWVAEDGMKMQSFGCQLWDTGFAIQALLASNLPDETDDALKRGHNYIKASQVRENPSGDFRSMYRHISKGAWTFSDRDHGWQVSDCTAEALKVNQTNH
jgi:hypothetical protein